MNGVFPFKGHTKGGFIRCGLRVVGTPLKIRCHFDVQVVDWICDFALSGFPDKKRTDRFVVLKGDSQGCGRWQNAMVIGMTMVGMDSNEWHIIYDAPMPAQLIRIQEVMLHFLYKEDLVEK